MEKHYAWKIASLAKSIDPTAAVAELERIEKEYDALTPETVLEASKAEDAVLHKLFVWDDAHAARQYRLQQARILINNLEVTVISDGQPRQIAAYEIIKTNVTKNYKSVSEFTKEDIQQVKQRTVFELNALKNKLSVYNELTIVSHKLDEAVDLLK